MSYVYEGIDGKFYCYHPNGLLVVGPFKTKERAVEAYMKELDTLKDKLDGSKKT
jgi:hypothetical protein